MQQIASIIKLIGEVSSYNDKLYLLKKNENVAGLKEILKFIYNPYCKTGISNKKLNKSMEDWPIGVGSIKVYWEEAIKYFSTHQTGDSNDLAMAKEFIRTSELQYGKDAMELAKAIVTQDLKIGITVTSLNKAYGKNFIPKIGCMLGTLYGDVGPLKTKWPCIVTEKLDGIRRILIKENGEVRCFSRSGHEDTGLVDIFRDAEYLPDNMVYDGELLATGTFKDCIAQRQATNSIANSNGTKTGLTFNVFDMVPVDEFYSGASKNGAKYRKVRLNATLMDDSIQYLIDDWWTALNCFGIHRELETIRPVPILGLAKNIKEVEPIVAEIWARGGEGVMLNTENGLYEIKRSKELLKVKHTEEYVLEVLDIIEGTGKFEDMMGSLVVEYKGYKLGVGSGFTDAQRREIWNNPNAFLNRKIEIETFGESKNSLGEVSLNCPIFKRFVGEEE